ncbi:MAG: immune inhibitor A domain-containing protein [Chthoniobacter sp.]
MDWITLDKSFWDYVQPPDWRRNPIAAFPARGFYTEVLKKLEDRHTISFRDFDDDGRDPNASKADSDGYVDIVVFVSGDAEINRGFRWQVSYTTESSAFAGERGLAWESKETTKVRNRNGSVSDVKVKVDDFVVIPAADVADGCIGVPCHEILHFIGLPDLYSRKNSFLGGVGSWCIMGRGCYESNRNSMGSPSARFPVLPSAPCRYFLGWGKYCECLPKDGTALMDSRRDGSYTIIRPTGEPEDELLFREACFVESYSPPTKESPWGMGTLPAGASGYLVWHVDGSVGRGGPDKGALSWPFAEPNQGQNDSCFDPKSFGKEGFHAPLARCIQADGHLDIESSDPQSPNQSKNFADVTDLFHDGNFLMFDDSDKGFAWYRHATKEPQIAFASGVVHTTMLAQTLPSGAVPAPGVGAPPVGAPPVGAPPVGAPPVGAPPATAGKSVAERAPAKFETADAPTGPAPSWSMDEANEIQKSALVAPKNIPQMATPTWATKWETAAKTSDESAFESPDAVHKMANRVELHCGTLGTAAYQFRDNVKVVLRAASSSDLKNDPALLQKLSTVSWTSFDAACSSLRPEVAQSLEKEWREQRTYSLAKKDAALAALNEGAARATRKFLQSVDRHGPNDSAPALVRAPDGNSVQELRRLNLPPLEDAPYQDAAARISKFNELAGLTQTTVSLKAIQPPPNDGFSDTEDGNKRILLSYVATIQGQAVPIATTEHWGIVTYDAKNHLQNIRFSNSPLRVGELPKEIEPHWSPEQAVDFVFNRLKAAAPPKDTIHAEFQLLPVGPKDDQRWEQIYRVTLPLPNGTVDSIYIKADTGERIK